MGGALKRGAWAGRARERDVRLPSDNILGLFLTALCADSLAESGHPPAERVAGAGDDNTPRRKQV
jgi:hypothetical protein